jgi:hypothetical protein
LRPASILLRAACRQQRMDVAEEVAAHMGLVLSPGRPRGGTWDALGSTSGNGSVLAEEAAACDEDRDEAHRSVAALVAGFPVSQCANQVPHLSRCHAQPTTMSEELCSPPL